VEAQEVMADKMMTKSRFSRDVQKVLLKAGWNTNWRSINNFEREDGWEIFQAAHDILHEFGGLKAGGVWRPLIVGCHLVKYYIEIDHKICKTDKLEFDNNIRSVDLTGRYYPIGAIDWRNGLIFVAESGEIYVSWQDERIEKIAQNIDALIEMKLPQDQSTLKDYLRINKLTRYLF
jgi:SUKH-3 immunity protein